jgi:hypothetical protein
MEAEKLKINAEGAIKVRWSASEGSAITEAASVSQIAKVDLWFEDTDFKVMGTMELVGTNISGGMVTLEVANETENRISLLVQNPQIKPGVTYQVEFSGFKMAGSKQTMGPLRVVLSR